MLALVLLFGLCSCGGEDVAPSGVRLNPKNPITITIWHYYNGAVMNAFDQQVKVFNETVGLEKGIIVQGNGMGNVGELQDAVLAAARKDVGSQEMPNIFASYADTAYAAEQMEILADLGQFFTEAELAEYMPGYIDEGRIGHNNELRIFPIAKSTEIFMLNETDWQPFAAIGVTVVLEGDLPADGQHSALFADLAREGITNAVRHSLASEVRICWSESAESYTMTVSNSGFSTRSVIREGGGITELHRKLAQVGGSLQVTTRPAFVLAATIPKEVRQ